MKDATGQESFKSMKEKLCELKRNKVKKKITRNLGKVIEEEDKLICYIDKKNFERGRASDCYISCCGIYLKDKELAKKYRLAKRIVYVIEKIDFRHNRVTIFGHENCEIIIRNCDFASSLRVTSKGKCTLENVSIKKHTYPVIINAKELIIKDTTITDRNVHATEFFGIDITADNNIEINNSTLKDEASIIRINSKNELHMYCSDIMGRMFFCDAKYAVTGFKNLITAWDSVELSISKFDRINVASPMISCNGKYYNQSKNSVSTIKQTKDLLTEKKLELLALLNNIKNKADIKSEEDLKEYQSTLKNKPISKVLAKRFTIN